MSASSEEDVIFLLEQARQDLQPFERVALGEDRLLVLDLHLHVARYVLRQVHRVLAHKAR